MTENEMSPADREAMENACAKRKVITKHFENYSSDDLWEEAFRAALAHREADLKAARDLLRECHDYIHCIAKERAFRDVDYLDAKALDKQITEALKSHNAPLSRDGKGWVCGICDRPVDDQRAKSEPKVREFPQQAYMVWYSNFRDEYKSEPKPLDVAHWAWRLANEGE